ncbi:unnamed protein product [Sphenostylis stenocarpa]|uniref:CW-type domain-containing protein n=1 Tax=Sphenostylis stenocarpa TaxID=92480 RepID=A0AA86T317_9FABA|nr:unnamed protein product [Sphenostylis stenocarpa]
MKEDTELEEGEACYYKDDDENNIDPDSFSYIDEKIQHFLGHFQKEFEGGVSAENLGAKFGGYGSFLPTQERSPCIRSHPRTPQRNHNSPKFNNNLHMEAVSHNKKAPTNVPPPTRPENVSGSSHPFRDLREASVNNLVKKEQGISSGDIAERCTLKHVTTKITENSTDQRTLKFRIKMKSNILAQKNAEIYSGLGLDDSPSSSMGNSPGESEGMPPVYQESAEDSPTGIIQVMTSFPIPGGVLISPLHEIVLNLMKNDKVIGDNRISSSLNGRQDLCSMSTDESDSFVGAGHSKNMMRIVRQSDMQLELKHPNGTLSEKDTTLHKKKKLRNRTPDHKDFLSNELKWTPLSSSICDAGETAEGTAKAIKPSKKVNENGVQGRMVSEEALKEESLESISGQDFGKTVKQTAGNGFMKTALEHKLESSHKDNSMNPKNNNTSSNSIISNKFERDVKCKVDHKSEIHQKVKAVCERKNKSIGDQSAGKSEAVARKDSFGGTNNAMVIDKGSASFDNACRSKMKSRSPMDQKCSDSNRDSMKEKRSEWKVDSLVGNGAIKNAKISNGKHNAFGSKVKERMTGHKVVNPQAGPCIKETSASLPIAESNLAPEMISSAVAAPQLIAEDWVCCDSCQKWRLLPTGTKPEHLPEKWLCSMLNWLPGMNSCEFSEDETTKALYALYQMPISQVQSNIQSHGTETALGVSSTNSFQYGLNQNMCSSDMCDRGRKKLVIKEKAISGINNDMRRFSNSVKANVQVSGKNRSLNGLNQHPADFNPMKKMSSSKQLGKPDKMIEEKHVPKENEKKVNGDDRKHVKLKRKLDADQYKSGIPKKSKTENVFYVNKQLNPDMHLEKVSVYSRNGMPTKASGKDMRKYDEYCLSEDAQDRLPVTVTKEVDQAQGSSGLTKKRKLKDGPDDEKQYGEEGDTNEFSKEKKYRILNKKAKSVTEGDNKLSKGGMRQVCLAGNGDQMAIGTEVRLGDKGNQLRKHRKNVASLDASDGIDQLGKNLSTRPHSLVATSSSSKVSGSHKAKTKLGDVRGSPVESVTSSPLRAFNMDKNNFSLGDTSVKDNVTKGCLSSVGSKRNVNNRERKLSVKLKEGRVPHDLHYASQKLSSIEYQVEDAEDTSRLQAKKPSELKNIEGGVCVEQPGYCANGVHHEEKVNKENQESELSWQKSGKVLKKREKGRKFGSHVGTDNMKISVAKTDGYSKKGGRYDSVVNPSNHASGAETKNVVKYTFPKSKSEINSFSQKSALGHQLNETGKQTEIKPRDFESSVPNMDAQCSSERKTISLQNPTHDLEEENKVKVNHVIEESRVVKSKVPSSAAGEVKREALSVGSRIVPQYQKGSMSNEHPVKVLGNSDLVNSIRNYANVSNNAAANCSSGNSVPDQQPTVSSPVRTNFNQTSVDTLEEAAKLKERADNYKNSGFAFESNETYFQAGVKFLHGASLLENCHNEISKHGEMSQMQIFSTAAKLFKCCAHEYEARQEMAAAALAYKCMEVAYMRVVYCKNSSINRDRHELQSTLQMVSQGESPSSSASDVDNLYNQAAADKATLPRGTNTHAAINQVISARTHPNLIRLLDFTKDIHFAMEASEKCQNTFTAANVIMEEARNKDCIASIRSVIEFGFQDVDELVRLVWTATKAISRAGLGGARD